jgi:orotate phosphoribosyltransferase
VLVDDVVRTGAQLAGAAPALVAESARVCTAVCAVDRGLGAGQIADSQVALRTLLTVRS